MIQTINPATGDVLQNYPEMSAAAIDSILSQSHRAYSDWRRLSFAERAQPLLRTAELLLANKETYATLMAQEMGKPIVSARAEVEKCANVCRYYATEGESFIKDRLIATELQKSYVSYQPLGVILAIMPWNYPFWQVFRFAAPNLVAGNGAVLKHSPNVTGCGLAIEQLLREAGFPEHLFRTLVIEEEQTSQVIADPRVVGVTLTGSERAGRAVASQAGSHLKKVVLEMGGSDPYLVLEDADLEKAAAICVHSRLANSGQVCIAGKRLIINQKVKRPFLELVLQQLPKYVMGDPLDEKTYLGPLARDDLRTHLHQQVQESLAANAELITGGELPNCPGFYYPITVLVGVKAGMTAYHEELFGPVITLIEAHDEDDAIRIANDTRYGLAAAVFTRDVARGEKIAREQLQAGTCYVNQLVSSDPRLPFGGIKSSGIGRELAQAGMHEFLNIKTIGVG